MLQDPDIESAKVRIFNMNVLSHAFDKQLARGEVDFARTRHPQSLTEGRLLKDQRSAFLNGRHKPAANSKGVVESRFETRDFAVRFIDPDCSGNLPRGAFGHAVGFGVRISDEIIRQRVSAVE